MNIKEVTQLTYDSMQENNKKMTEVQEAIEQRQVGLEVTLRDSISKMDTVQESALKHARLTNDTMVREVNRFE